MAKLYTICLYQGNASNCTSPDAVKKVRQQIVDNIDLWLSECKNAGNES